MIVAECSQSFIEFVEVCVVANHGYAHADTILLAACGRKRNGTYAIAHEFLLEFSACHIAITGGEEETVGNRLIAIYVIDHMETVILEYLHHAFATASVLATGFNEFHLSFHRAAEQSCHSVLGRMGRAGRSGIEHSEDISFAEAGHIEEILQTLKFLIVKTVADAYERNALACVRENL